MSDAATSPEVTPASSTREVDKQILSLALPAFAALIAEPLMVLADSAMVGHLGKDSLAGLALGSTIVSTIIYLFIFLAYTTTASASRALGSGNQALAVRKGLDGTWFAALVGIILGPATWLLAPFLVSAFNPTEAVSLAATSYVRASAPGITAMFVVLATTGALRGLLDTKTPMLVSISGSIFNVFANAFLIYGLELGIVGSGLGTSISQWLMALVLVFIVARSARAQKVSLSPSLAGAKSVGLAGAPLMVRTVNLRLSFILTTWAATRVGAGALAGHQIIISIWDLGSYAMDALAIASQALIGHGLGTGEKERVRTVLRRCLRWGIWIGLAVGLIFSSLSFFLPRLFTSDPTVISAASIALIIAGLGLPLAGYVFILDGVLIGADRAKYLAGASVVNLLAYLPFCLLTGFFGYKLGQTWGLASIWLAFTFIFTAARALTNRFGARDLM
ncbi:MATE family efflux transporter [Actinomycetaceae bacterium TAE3-ERU4]|nr:MATE family efflux transporter [Actinomycetaceae bacterium TAE3-ERU4]